jgi:hypothetical protein
MKKTLFPVILGLFACMLTASANAIPTLTLTEVSSTQLDYSWDTGLSGTIQSTGDSWTVNISSPIFSTFFASLTYSSTEPSENSHNEIQVVWDSTDFGVTVSSDLAGVGQYNDGVAVTAFDAFQTATFNVIFLDKGDSTVVPDAGNTLLLLLLASGTLVWVQRRRAGSGA